MRTRPSALATNSLMPGTSMSAERVAISPRAQGILTSKRFVPVSASGMANTVKPAGAGSVSHMASIAASFMRWLSLTV